MKLLVVKTSSIGDVLHTFPAVSDAARALPGLTVDWVIERELAIMPTWHPAVRRVIDVDYRRWRYHPFSGVFGGHFKYFCQILAAESYDTVVDAQGLYKSAVITRLAQGARHGFDLASAREKLAPLAYAHRHRIPNARHAVERLRQLFAEALDYPLPTTPPEYRLDRERLPPPPLSTPYILFLHGAAWRTKRWPEVQWQGLAALAAAAGFAVRLPWAAKDDRARAERIAAAHPAIAGVATPSLEAAASLIAGAAGVVAVDTGLGHLAAALGVPTVSLYGPTGPHLTGTIGERQKHLVAALPCAPCRDKICNVTGRPSLPAPCLQSLTEGTVWLALRQAMGV